MDTKPDSTEAAPPPHGGSPVERLVIEFFAACESGERPSAAMFVARLTSGAERAEFSALLAAGEQAHRAFPVTPRPGLLLAERYQLVEEIGSGGLSKVWSAVDLELSRRVAVKILDPGAVSGAELADFFVRERDALVAIQHPGIVPIHDARQSGGLSFLVMDQVHGVSLSRVLQRLTQSVAGTPEHRPRPRDLVDAVGGGESPGRMSLLDSSSYPRSAARMIGAVLQILEAAHTHGVVHRDVKPGNVMLLPGGHPALLDFGLAGIHQAPPGAVSQRLFGSPGHVAPEQIDQLRTGSDPRSDIYQTGLLLYEMLTLREAFARDVRPETLDRIRRGDVPAAHVVATWVPLELSAICQRAMAPDPERRYPTARLFRADLERYLAGRDLPDACHGMAPWVLRLRFLLRRRRTPLLVASTLVATLALLIVVLTPHSPLVLGQVLRGEGAIVVESSDGSQRVVEAMLLLQQDGRTAFFVPLRAAPGTNASGGRVRFSLPAGVSATVLDGIAGEPRLACFHADRAGRLARVKAFLGKLEQHIDLMGNADRGVTAAMAEEILKALEEETRSAGGPSPEAIPMTHAQLLAAAPVQAEGAGLVWMVLR